MELAGWLMVGLLSGSFFFGIWYILIREDTKKDLRRQIGGSSFASSNRAAANFGAAKSAIDGKLAEYQVFMRDNAQALEARRAQLEAQKLAEEKDRRQRLMQAEMEKQEELRREEERLAAERAARIAAQEEADRLEQERLALEEEAKMREEEEARRAEEERQLRELEDKLKAEEEERKVAEEQRQAEEEARRLEEERIAEEARARQAAEEEMRRQEEELQRQRDLAAAEAQRQAEIEAQRLEEERKAKAASDQARLELMERLKREGAKTGDVQISLMWNNYNDLDLHVVAPSGERIHGGNRKSACGGELDVDANVRPDSKKPVENVVWDDSDGNEAPGGIYKVYVHHYKKHNKRGAKDPTTFKIMVNNGGEYLEYEDELTFGDPIKLICEFDVDPPHVRNAKKKAAKIALEAAERGESVDLDELTNQILDPENLNKPQTELEVVQEQEREASVAEENRAAEIEEQRMHEEARAQREEANKLRHEEAERQAKSHLQKLTENPLSPKLEKEWKNRMAKSNGNSGEIQISLIWDNLNDLDLHVFAPSGEKIDVNNRQSECGGILDLDANISPDNKKPLENVIWLDELTSKSAPHGTYRVMVHHNQKHNKRNTKDPTAYSVIVKVDQMLAEFNGSISHGEPAQDIVQFTLEESEIREARKQLVARINQAKSSGESIDEAELSYQLIGTIRNRLREESMNQLLDD